MLLMSTICINTSLLAQLQYSMLQMAILKQDSVKVDSSGKLTHPDPVDTILALK